MRNPFKKEYLPYVEPHIQHDPFRLQIAKYNWDEREQLPDVDEMKESIREDVQRVIAHALSSEDLRKPNSGELINSIGEHSIVLKTPEDLHFIPLLEAVIFEELTALCQEDSDVLPFPIDMMAIDPLYRGISQSEDGVELHGETILDHEIKHNVQIPEGVANENKQYIVFNFGREAIESFDKEILRMFPYNKSIRGASSNSSDSIVVSLAPDYPSSCDILGAHYVANSTLRLRQRRTRQETLRSVLQDKTFNGKGEMYSSQMVELSLFPLWQQERANDINFSLYPERYLEKLAFWASKTTITKKGKLL